MKAAAAKIFKKAFQRASGRSVLMNFDIPDPESVKNSYLQKTLLSLRKVSKFSELVRCLRYLRMLPIDEVPHLRLGA